MWSPPVLEASLPHFDGSGRIPMRHTRAWDAPATMMCSAVNRWQQPYPNLRLVSRIFEREGHSAGVIGNAFLKRLEVVFMEEETTACKPH